MDIPAAWVHSVGSSKKLCCLLLVRWKVKTWMKLWKCEGQKGMGAAWFLIVALSLKHLPDPQALASWDELHTGSEWSLGMDGLLLISVPPACLSLLVVWGWMPTWLTSSNLRAAKSSNPSPLLRLCHGLGVPSRCLHFPAFCHYFLSLSRTGF